MKTVLPDFRFTTAERILKVQETLINRALGALSQAMQSSFDAVWNNPHQTPAQMLAAQGNKAVSNFEDHARTVVYLLQSGEEVPAKYQAAPLPYTAHQDGTITLD
jgi:hypothetical protein